MEFEKRGKKACYDCQKYIDLSKDKFTLLATMNMEDGAKDELIYFHFKCFVNYWNKKSIEKAQKLVKSVQDKALEVFNNPTIKALLEQSGGDRLLGSMLNAPIEEVEVRELSFEKKDGKGKKTKRKA